MSCRLVEDPEGLFFGGADGAGGEGRADRRIEDEGDDRLFVGAEGVEGCVGALVDGRVGEGEAPLICLGKVIG